MSTQFNRQSTVNVSPTLDTDAYTANDVAGGLMSINVHASGGGGTLRRLVIADDDNEKAAIDLYFFDSAPTTIADDAAFAPTFADLEKLIGKVSIAAGDYTTVNSNAYAIKTDVDIDFTSENGLLYCYAVVTGTPTYTAATDLTFRFHFWLD